jgi:hypothetical protein
MLHGEQRGLFDLSFAIPAECADRLQSGLADIGIVPAVELNRIQPSDIDIAAPGTGRDGRCGLHADGAQRDCGHPE